MLPDSCACPRGNAKGCYRARHGLDLCELLGDSLPADDAEEECVCSCHEMEDVDDDA